MINAVAVQDAGSMHTFPRHATVRHLGLCGPPAEATKWLRNYAASGPEAVDRLLQIESVVLDIYIDIDEIQLCGEVRLQDIAKLFDAVSDLCPNMHILVVHLSGDNAVDHAVLPYIGRRLPCLTELSMFNGLDDVLEIIDNHVDWSACIPPHLTKLSIPCSTLPHNLIQHLVQMPTMVEVEASILHVNPGGGPAIKTESCAWKKLR